MAVSTFDHLKVLVVEDNVQIRGLLRSLLHALGIKHVIEAEDGESGYESLRQNGPDFVLSDLSMKPMDGIEFTRKVRTSQDSPNPYVPIVMVTGHTERRWVESARDSGVTEFLAKPITTQNLFLRISEIVDRPRQYVRSESYFGPDRRRRKALDHTGPWRRREDKAGEIETQ
jgi:two-component system chemotaxis response regulator CheY